MALQHLRNILKYYCLIRVAIEKMAAGEASTHTAPCISVGQFTLSLYMWAVAVVMTRQNNMPIGSKKRDMVLSLVPVFDLANHESGEFSTDFVHDETSGNKGGLVCFAHRDFLAGEQLRIFYGLRC